MSAFVAIIRRTLCATLALTSVVADCANGARGGEMALIPAGRFKPFTVAGTGPKVVTVSSFYLDVLPVTNADFLQFVKENPRWRRSEIKRSLADSEYLKAWAGDLELGEKVNANAPVTFVSWHSARAYARWIGKRLPTTLEWEYAARASRYQIEGEKDPVFLKEINQWHSTPSPETLPPTGQTQPNYFGVKNMHGLVWEWVSDFNLGINSADSRGSTGRNPDASCGGGSSNATDRDNFPAFMRYGFRGSLKSSYTVHNLGFRCAKNSRPNLKTNHEFK